MASWEVPPNAGWGLLRPCSILGQALPLRLLHLTPLLSFLSSLSGEAGSESESEGFGAGELGSDLCLALQTLHTEVSVCP